MGDRQLKYLEELLKRPGNDRCADCGNPDPCWGSCSLGVFICDGCAQIHRSLDRNISNVKSVRLDSWSDEEIETMESNGNDKAREMYEIHVPLCYRRPGPTEPKVLIEQWIQAKYYRREFTNVEQLNYLSGCKEGYLWKQGKAARKFQQRRFVLNEAENLLIYFNKPNAKLPKAQLRLDRMNVVIVPEKIGHANGMQIIYTLESNDIRNFYLYADTGQVLVEWYTAIRSAKLNRLSLAYPNARMEELVGLLTQDFLREGWLSKTGPRTGDSYKKRWMSLGSRRLFYYSQPLDAFPLGEIPIGTKDIGYTVREGVPPGIRALGFPFTLKTPMRQFHLSASTERDREEWLAAIQSVISVPLSPVEAIRMSTRIK